MCVSFSVCYNLSLKPDADVGFDRNTRAQTYEKSPSPWHLRFPYNLQVNKISFTMVRRERIGREQQRKRRTICAVFLFDLTFYTCTKEKDNEWVFSLTASKKKGAFIPKSFVPMGIEGVENKGCQGSKAEKKNILPFLSSSKPLFLLTREPFHPLTT